MTIFEAASFTVALVSAGKSQFVPPIASRG